MKFTETEVDYILKALEFGLRHTPIQLELDQFISLKDKITHRKNRKIPVIHYHWHTEKEYAYPNSYTGVMEMHPWTHPMAVAPCGVIAHEDPQYTEPGWRDAILTKEMEDVTCKKCRKWLHLDTTDSQKETKPKLEFKVSRNITLEL